MMNLRVQDMRVAEAALIKFATKFKGVNNDDRLRNEVHKMELFDTKIPRGVIPLEDGEDCQINSCENYNTDKEFDNDLVMHGIKVTSNTFDKDTSFPLVLLHGYANGSLYFYRNLLGLSKHHFNGEVYALDMLGWGLSSRPKYKLDNGKKQLENEIDMTEEFFVESLEAWRKANNLEKMILGGHSMGGYFSVAYTEKYPQHVDRLILISPVGVPHLKEDILDRKDIPWKYKVMGKCAKKLWITGYTPSGLVRSLPESQSRKIVGKYVEKRLPAITCPEERKHLTDYLYTNAALPASGENCLNKFLNPFGYAKRPTVDRIPHLKVKNVSFIYGEKDWMDSAGGLEVKEICQKLKGDGKNNIPNIQVLEVKDAGHLLMLENWEEFNSAVIISGGGEQNLSKESPRPRPLT